MKRREKKDGERLMAEKVKRKKIISNIKKRMMNK